MSDNGGQLSRSEEEQKRANAIHDSFRAELLKRQLSNSENYDKAILTLSSSALAISISFINFIKDISLASYIWLMSFSWLFFTLTIFLSLVAYYVGNKAIERQLVIAEDYYLSGNLEAVNHRNKFTTVNEWLNVWCGILFVSGIFCVAMFVVINVHKGGSFMSDKKSIGCLDSASIPSMQRVSVGEMAVNSAGVPRMQAAPASVVSSSAPASQQASSSSSGSSGD